jgi:acetyl-CoA acetyltransferase family protein
VNRLCGSGFEAIVSGAHQILLGDAEVALVGGVEAMSQVPYVLRGARWGYRMGHGEMEDQLSASLTDAHVKLPMAITAENLAEMNQLSRETCDAFALESQKKAASAWKNGVFSQEVAPIKIQSKKGETLISQDEHVRPDATLEGLAKLKPVFKKDGVVTAGNASGIVDGACALILTTEQRAKAQGWRVLGHLRSWAAKGCDPKIMGIGPVPATQAVMNRYAKEFGKPISVKDFRLVEINEAFASQYLSVEKGLGLDRSKTNIHGGAIALGHPLGASGARLVTHLLYSLPQVGGGLGLASACIGGGQGMSVIVEVAGT